MRTRLAPFALAAFIVALVTGAPLLRWYDAASPFASLARLELESPLGRTLRAVHGVASWLLVVLFLALVIEAAAGLRRPWRLIGAVLSLPALVVSGLLLRGGPWRAYFADTRLSLVLHATTFTVLFALFVVPLRWRRDDARLLLVLTGVTAALTTFLAWLFPAALWEQLPPLGAWPPFFFGGVLLLAASLAVERWRLLVTLVAAAVIAVSGLIGLTRSAPALASVHVGTRWRELSFASLEAPLVRGRPEGCVACHARVQGLGASHEPHDLGCSVCHLGHPFRPDAEGAHDDMVLVPGNLDGAPRTCGACHAEHVARVSGSLMARANGIVAVDRFVFGEQPTPDGEASMSQLGRSDADGHLRGLCVPCHLAYAKQKPAPVSGLSRGGGCVACHLREDVARTDAKTNPAGFVHPGLSVQVRDASCTGCHSRSGRISLAFAGWRDAEGDPSVDASSLSGGRSPESPPSSLSGGRSPESKGAPSTGPSTGLRDENSGAPSTTGPSTGLRDENSGAPSTTGPSTGLRAEVGSTRPSAAPPTARTLEDGRPVVRAQADVHHEKGLACIDCHTGQETMGDGRAHLHEEDATHVRCTTCHRTSPARGGVPDGNAALVLRLRGQENAGAVAWGEREGAGLLVEERSGEVLTNAVAPADGGLEVELRGKLDGALHVARPPSGACTKQQHARVACQACHSAWVHRCSGCHMQFDREANRWTEYDVPPAATPPTLGVFTRDGVERIEPFVPGMVLTLNPPDAPAPDPLPAAATELYGEQTRFVRAWAFAAPHTTTRAGQACRACHLDPQALGLGRGVLSLEDDGGVVGWRFEPAQPPSRFDGLPHDAWIAWDSDRQGITTRLGQRPLSAGERARVLRVGACLACHAAEQQPALYDDFTASLERRTPACRAPW